MTVNQLKSYFESQLESQFSKQETQVVFYWLLKKQTRWTKTEFFLNQQEVIQEQIIREFDKYIQRLQIQEPIQYILGNCEFMGNLFKVNPNVLIPRPETEDLVQWILNDEKNKPQLKVIDIGTGSGCIAISLAMGLNAEVMGVDISKKALEVAVSNAKNRKAQVAFFEADILSDSFKDVFPDVRFDILVSNPPYVTQSDKKLMQDNVLKWEPSPALFVSDKDPLLFYRSIAEKSKMYLKPKGRLYLEINEKFGKEMIDLLQLHNFISIELKKDMSGKDRMIKAIKNS